MAIKRIVTDFIGEIGVMPRIVRIFSTDTFAAVTTAGYLSSAQREGFTFYPSDIVALTYGTNVSQFFTLSFSGNTITLVPNEGDVILPVVSGDFAVFSGTAGNIADLGYLPSNAAKTKVVMANGAVVANHIGCYTDTAGTIGVDAATAINGGNIQAGLSGTAGTVASFPATASKGSLIIAGVANTGNTNTTISNAAMGQATVVSMPDPGVATTNFILADSAGTQTITTGNLIVAAGNLQAGSSGNAGTVSSFASTATTGSLKLAALANSGNFITTISNAVQGQATVYSIPDAGQTTGSILVSKVPADVGANLISFDITVGQAALASAGSVTLIASSGSKQYKIRSLFLNSGGTNFSGGSGNRLGQVTDGTTVFSVTPAAQLQTLVNTVWGGTAIPFPASAAINTSTAAGASLVYKYSGGTTDYTAGSVVISGIVERVA